MSLGIDCAPAVVDSYVAAGGPAQLLQLLHERRDAGLAFRIVRGQVHEHPDAAHPLGLLRAGRERPSRCRAAAKQDDEIAPSYA
jgi:hypothetical protein